MGHGLVSGIENVPRRAPLGSLNFEGLKRFVSVQTARLMGSGEVRAEFEAMISEEFPAGKQAILISVGGKAQLPFGPWPNKAEYLKEAAAVHHQSLDVRVKSTQPRLQLSNKSQYC
ncbi:hypothetical protein OIU76_011722 [Salix suchowensis]|nr:hypothetical protein OIU76_011722 [Salix suchowensis]